MSKKPITTRATPELKYVDGRLHQLFMVSDGAGSESPEWLPIPRWTTGVDVDVETIDDE